MPKPPADTVLEKFMRENKLVALDVAFEARLSRQHLLRVRNGTADPGFWTATRIRDACSRLLHRAVRFDELFGPTDPQARRLRRRRNR